MAEIEGGVRVGGFISPSDSEDTYPVVDPIYGIGGFRVVDTLLSKYAIPYARRRVGMIVRVQSNKATGLKADYRLIGLGTEGQDTDASHWEELNLSKKYVDESIHNYTSVSTDNSTLEDILISSGKFQVNTVDPFYASPKYVRDVKGDGSYLDELSVGAESVSRVVFGNNTFGLKLTGDTDYSQGSNVFVNMSKSRGIRTESSSEYLLHIKKYAPSYFHYWFEPYHPNQKSYRGHGIKFSYSFGPGLLGNFPGRYVKGVSVDTIDTNNVYQEIYDSDFIEDNILRHTKDWVSVFMADEGRQNPKRFNIEVRNAGTINSDTYQINRYHIHFYDVYGDILFQEIDVPLGSAVNDFGYQTIECDVENLLDLQSQSDLDSVAYVSIDINN